MKPETIDKIGKVSSLSVHKATGRHWDEWVAILEKAGAATWTHQEIVAWLKKKHRLGPWWQQGVTMGFEIHIGRRAVGQDLKGQYMITATKSIPCPVARIWKEATSAEGVAIWLQPMFPVKIAAKTAFETQDGFFGEIRTLAPGRRIRMSWQDPNWDQPTTVEFLLVPRPGKKSIVVLNHTRIRDLRVLPFFRKRWKAALQGLADRLK